MATRTIPGQFVSTWLQCAREQEVPCIRQLNPTQRRSLWAGAEMVESRRAALSAAVGLIAASRYDIDASEVGFDERVTDAELFEAVTKVAGWLARHTSEGDSLLSKIGQYVSSIEDDPAA